MEETVIVMTTDYRTVLTSLALAAVMVLFSVTAYGEALGELTLPQVQRLAVERHPWLRASAGEVVTAAAQVGAQRAAARPSLGASATWSAVSDVPGLPATANQPAIELGADSNLVGSLTARWLLSSGGKTDARITEARHVLAATQEHLERVRQQVERGAATAYYGVLKARGAETVADLVYETATAHLREAESQRRAGTGTTFDVIRAEVQVAAAQRQQVEARNGIQIAKATLATAMGLLPTDVFEVVEVKANFVPATDLPTALEVAGRARPELREGIEFISAAERRRAGARALRHPDLALTAKYDVVQNEVLLNQGGWSLGLSATVNLWDGGYAHSKVAEAEGQLTQLEAGLEHLRQAIALEVIRAHADTLAADEQWALSRHELASALEADRLASLRYREGLGTSVEVADAQTVLARARQNLNAATYDRLIARIELEFAMGAREVDVQEENLPRRDAVTKEQGEG